VTQTNQYDDLIAKESHHWGEVRPDPQNPQIWHDPMLFDIFFGKEHGRFVEYALAHGPRILELGCGEGNLSIRLASRGLDVTAIDLSAERIERARTLARALELQIQPNWIAADLNTFPLPHNGYDCVIAHDSLHHILHLDRLCEQVLHTLKPGGYFVIMDYIGMGFLRKVFGGILYAMLPTYQPYKVKWQLRKRVRGFLATERQKRDALDQGGSAALHGDSPFEEISQQSIITEIEKRFEVTELQTFCPFWFYLAAKVRVPSGWKYPLAHVLRAFDDLIVRSHLARGAYVLIAARTKFTTT
jgi:SAM-dependent methyltransferase